MQKILLTYCGNASNIQNEICEYARREKSMNTEALKTFMETTGISAKQMANVIGVDISTWYRKLQTNGDSFTIREMNTMIRRCNMSTAEAANIFFNEKLA